MSASISSNTVRNHSKASSPQDNPFHVAGIAMIVDQRGIGARLVARYPAQPPPPPPSRTNGKHDDGPSNTTNVTNQNGTGGDNFHSEEHNMGGYQQSDDLFFTLTARQMAKLFRTKKSLCGQPMTLTVNGMVFCCRAILMQGDDAEETASTGPSSTSGSDTKNELILFSVIVALSSYESHTSIPFSSWLSGEDQLDFQRYLKETTAAGFTSSNAPSASNNKKANDNNGGGAAGNGKVSSAFLSIRRVHISLARYCRVLEREERRCHYVSIQAMQFFKIRNERQKKWEERKAAAASLSTASKAAGVVSGSASSSASVMSTKSSQTTISERGRGRHHRHTGSFTSSSGVEEALTKSQQVYVTTIEEEQEKEQEILELMLSSPPPRFESPSRTVAPIGTSFGPSGSSYLPRRHHGNLVRELVQLFHSLSRNDQEYPLTPTALLCERDAVIYVNQHIAIPVEAASLKRSSSHHIDGAGPVVVRPYYTLLFPHASPSELLQAFQSSGSAAPQRLQHLLLTVNPQKPLTEIALDANLPLYSTMEIASYLVAHGACVTSPVVSRHSRLVCLNVEKIHNLSLEFSQTFSNVNLFRLVSFLTSSRTLGEAMALLVQSEEGAWLRDCLAPSGYVRQDLSKVLEFSPEEEEEGPSPKINNSIINNNSGNNMTVSSSVAVAGNGTAAVAGFGGVMASPGTVAVPSTTATSVTAMSGVATVGTVTGTTTTIGGGVLPPGNVNVGSHIGSVGVGGGGGGGGIVGTAVTGATVTGTATTTTTTNGAVDSQNTTTPGTAEETRYIEELEELLYAMTIWLLSHRVLTQIQDYMVMIDVHLGGSGSGGSGRYYPIGSDSGSVNNNNNNANMTTTNFNNMNQGSSSNNANFNNSTNNMSNVPIMTNSGIVGNTVGAGDGGGGVGGGGGGSNSIVEQYDEALFRDLQVAGLVQSGDISIMALAWKMGMDAKKLRAWGIRHPKVRVLSRIPAPGDDWESDIKY